LSAEGGTPRSETDAFEAELGAATVEEIMRRAT